MIIVFGGSIFGVRLVEGRLDCLFAGLFDGNIFLKRAVLAAFDFLLSLMLHF